MILMLPKIESAFRLYEAYHIDLAYRHAGIWVSIRVFLQGNAPFGGKEVRSNPREILVKLILV